MVNRKQSPRIADAVEFDVQLPPLKSFKLDNNIPVYLIPSEEQETLQLEWVFDAGNWYEPASLVASSTNYLIKNGTIRKTALEINETIEYYGAFLSVQCNHEYASLTLHCLEKHVTNLLPVIYEILTSATVPEDEVEIYKQNNKQRLSVNLQKCDFVANQLIDKYIFGEHHPYGRYSTIEAFDHLQRNDLIEFYKRYYSFNHCKIFAAGKTPEHFDTLINHVFGKDTWNGKQEIVKKELPLQPAAEKRYHITNDPNGVQSAIRIARPFPDRYHPDVPKMQMLNTILGGYFGSRLMSNIREDKGYTYGIFSGLYIYNKAGEFGILTEAGRNVTEETIGESYKEMQRLRDELIPEDELSLVRNYMIGGLLGDLDGSFKVIRRWKSLILSGLDEQYFYNAVNIIKTISAGELQELAQKYFVKDDFYELVVI